MPAYPAVFDLADLNGSNGFSLVGPGDYQAEFNGSSVAGIGDINGDGFDDVLSGATHVGVWYDGAVQLIRGTDAPHAALGELGGFEFRPEGGEYEYFGDVQGAGDINGDGYADFIASGGGGTLDPTPRNYVVFGSAGALPGDLETVNGSNGFKVQDGDVSAAGDINGDGFADLFLDHNVLFGKAGGFTQFVDATGLDGTNGFALTNVTGPYTFAGDLNGDGFGDIIIGNSGADNNGTNAGEAYVVFGKAGGFAASFDPSTVDGTTGVKIIGAAAGNMAGASVASAGDVNGDGIDDVVIHASGSATSYVVFGKTTGLGATIDLSSIDGTNGFRITNASGAAKGTGDINGDTLGDLILASGQVIFGQAGHMVPDINANGLNGTNGFTIVGTGIDIRTWRFDGAGDINGDGFDDIVIGTRFADDPRAYGYYSQYPNAVGMVHFIFGQIGPAQNWVGTSADELHVGSGDGDILDGARGKDHLKGVGGDDILIGGPGGDVLDGGEGSDTASYAQSTGGVIVNLAAGTATGPSLGNDTLISIENVIGTGGIDDITGDAGANRLDGGAGADTLRGGLGNDTYVIDDAGDAIVETRNQGIDTVETVLAAYALGADLENLTFVGGGNFTGTGNTLANILTGGAGDDELNGGRGTDTLRGGLGNDTYVVDHPGDVVEELAGQGVDTVETTLNYTLGDNVEGLLLRGTAALSGTGNGLANALTGNNADNTLSGLDGGDTLLGKGGADKLLGGDGDDRLDGGTGDDNMRGGLGNDTYIVDSVGDLVSEANGDGIDLVRTAVSYTLGSGVENLTITTSQAVNGTGNSLANVLIGGNGANVLAGLRGNDTLTGGSGADTFVFGASFGHDRITDFASNDVISFQDGLFTGFADVQAHAAQVGANIVITYNSGNTLTIDNYALASLNAGDFLFA